MELKMNQYQLPEKISFNFEEIKGEIAEKLKKAEVTIYNEDQIKQAKADRADLNRLKKALNDERIRLEKEYMIPFNKFKSEINEIISMIDKPVAAIDQQIKGYEEQKKDEKQKQIQEYWNSVTSPEHPLTFQRVMDARWLNASISMKAIQEEINGILAKYAEDISTLSNLPEFAFEAVEVYKNTLNLGMAVNEAHRLSEQAKRKAEYEAEQARLKAEDEAKKLKEFIPPVAEDTPFEQCMNPPELPTEPLREAICFRAYLTQDDAFALKNFFNSRSIPFEKI